MFNKYRPSLLLNHALLNRHQLHWFLWQILLYIPGYICEWHTQPCILRIIRWQLERTSGINVYLPLSVSFSYIFSWSNSKFNNFNPTAMTCDKLYMHWSRASWEHAKCTSSLKVAEHWNCTVLFVAPLSYETCNLRYIYGHRTFVIIFFSTGASICRL